MFRSFIHYFWGMIVRPHVTLSELSQETSIRFAVLLVAAGRLPTLLNVFLFTIFGLDWLGTRRELANPTYVGFFGRLMVWI